MANEITVTGLLQYTNAAKSIPSNSLSISNFLSTIVGSNYQRQTQSIPTTAGGTAINLGSVASPGGWIFVKNNDGTNYVQLMSAVSGTVFARLNPGEFALFRLDATVTAPAAISHTGACVIEYLILEA